MAIAHTRRPQQSSSAGAESVVVKSVAAVREQVSMYHLVQDCGADVRKVIVHSHSDVVIVRVILKHDCRIAVQLVGSSAVDSIGKQEVGTPYDEQLHVFCWKLSEKEHFAEASDQPLHVLPLILCGLANVELSQLLKICLPFPLFGRCKTLYVFNCRDG